MRVHNMLEACMIYVEGYRLPDGRLSVNGSESEDWPREIEIEGIGFRLSDTEDLDEHRVQACYFAARRDA